MAAPKATRLTCRKVPSSTATNGSAGQFEILLGFMSNTAQVPRNLVVLACFAAVQTGFPTGELT